MNTATTLAAYAAGLALVFGTAVGVGNAVGPAGSTAAAPPGGDHAATSPAVLPAAGLAVSQDGYTLLLDGAPTAAGRTAPLSFRLLDRDGRALTDYAVEHDKELHLVVVRRDGTGFQHLHPTRDAAGRWTTPLALPAAGTYKVFADFTPAGAEQGLTLATDVSVPGAVQTAVLPTQQRTAVVDGYTVTLTGDLVAGRSSPLVLAVSKDGRPVSDLEPYLGAYGHLVVLREGDLAYLHVHPEGDEPQGPTGGPEVGFAADVPTGGDYRLYLDFQHDGVVRTAALGLRTSEVGTTTGTGSTPDDAGHDDQGHGS